MIANHSFVHRRLLRHPLRFQSLVLSPGRHTTATGSKKLTRTPSAKVSVKSAPAHIRSLKSFRRKCAVSLNYINEEAGVLVPQSEHMAHATTAQPSVETTSTPTSSVNDHIAHATAHPSSRTTSTVTLSVNDLYRAANHAISKSPQKNKEDEAMLLKLKSAAYRHDMIAGIKSNEQRIDRASAENRARREANLGLQVVDEEAVKREEMRIAQWKQRLLRENTLREQYTAKMATKRLKNRLFELVEAAERGERLDFPPPSAADVATWMSYDAKWKEILDGKLQCLISFEMFPWPTLRGVTLESYEEFLLSPVRTGYEKMNLYERAAREQALWDEDHITEKVLPLVQEASRGHVAEGARRVRQHLENIVAKFNACEW